MSDQRCLASEAKAQEALEIIVRNGSRLKGLKTPPIVGFIHAKRHSTQDNRDADFLVTADDGCELPLQIKSSWRGKMKFERKQKRRLLEGKSVRVNEALCVDPATPTEKVVQDLIGYINRIYNFVRRMSEKAKFYMRKKIRFDELRRSRIQKADTNRISVHQMSTCSFSPA